MKYILDTSAVIAFIKGENGSKAVEKALLSGSCCIHSANWIEFYYKICKTNDEKAAEAAVELLRKLGVAVTDIADEAFRRKIATIKIAHSALSLGDCFAVGLAERLKGTVVTSDKRFSDATAFAKIEQIR